MKYFKINIWEIIGGEEFLHMVHTFIIPATTRREAGKIACAAYHGSVIQVSEVRI